MRARASRHHHGRRTLCREAMRHSKGCCTWNHHRKTRGGVQPRLYSPRAVQVGVHGTSAGHARLRQKGKTEPPWATWRPPRRSWTWAARHHSRCSRFVEAWWTLPSGDPLSSGTDVTWRRHGGMRVALRWQPGAPYQAFTRHTDAVHTNTTPLCPPQCNPRTRLTGARQLHTSKAVPTSCALTLRPNKFEKLIARVRRPAVR